MSVSHPHRRPRGFTLIELIIVIAIVGILASLGVPAMRTSYLRMQVRNEAHAVREYIVGARNQARKMLCPVAVTTSGNTVTLTPQNGATCSSTTFSATSRTFSNIITLGALSSALVFNGEGGVTSGNTVNMTINAKTATYAIQVLPAIGQVRINP